MGKKVPKKKKTRRRKSKKARGEQPVLISTDYYQRVFYLLHLELEREGYDSELPHPIRERYWRLLPYRTYLPLESKPLILTYIASVERELSETISKYSLAYYLHLYRRISPEAIGVDKQPMTVGIIRAILEAAIQKHAQIEPCGHVGLTHDISMDQILNGILMAPEFEMERQILQESNQMVLTDFSLPNLKAFYETERLAYETWRNSSMLRIAGKGAPIIVDESRDCVYDSRSEELNKLVRLFDERNATYDSRLLSATGVTGEEYRDSFVETGFVLLPSYNVGLITANELGSIFKKVFNIEFKVESRFNFIWFPFDLKQFRDNHSPFAAAFRDKYGVELDTVLLIIAVLCQRIFHVWMIEKNIDSVLRLWQRAYEGPYERNHVIDEITAFVPMGSKLLGIDENQVDQDELLKAFEFWELNDQARNDIDLAYPGPHSIFLPYGDDRVFLDYAWIMRRLYDLFVGVAIPDQNFKGNLLESVVRFERSILPVKECRSLDGSKKQIDASFQVGNRLVIIECKAVWKSIAFSRGDFQAIEYRNKVIINALEQVDEKASWLSNHPIGTNYDISHFDDILPIAVTPFPEYIPSLTSFFWLSDRLPRVLTPRELKSALKDGIFESIKDNVVHIQTT